MTFKNTLFEILNNIVDISRPYHLVDIYKTCKKAKIDIDSPMRVAITGQTKTGKSTMMNAFLGKEFVPAAQEVCTLNLNWFKHSDTNGGREMILVHYVDGRVKECLLEDNWKFVTKENQDNVKWVEVFYNHPILKEFEILDTPGLDSMIVEDSKRTKELLTHPDNRPHAIIYLMAREFKKEDIDHIIEFQQSSKLMNGLTCVGGFSCIDRFVDKAEFPLDYKQCFVTSNEIICNNERRYPEVRNAFCKIFPITAIFNLASEILTDNDWKLLREISKLDRQRIHKLIKNVRAFDNEWGVDLSKKIGIGTIGYIVQLMINDPEESNAQISQRLKDFSGLENMKKFVVDHFCRRAILLKSTLLHAQLKSEVQKIQNLKDNDSKKVKELFVLFDKIWIQEYSKYDFLEKYYDKKYQNLSQLENLKALALLGENGDDIRVRLSLDTDFSTENILKRLDIESTYWKGAWARHSDNGNLNEEILCGFLSDICDTLKNNATLWIQEVQ